ncbi:unannotated protein [freshwater metagenome]|uniref:Unannotated protein n=1 Tax=freshwater metagenome TaxID=449393 RepID=A0A6J6ZZR2_9ZZZZ
MAGARDRVAPRRCLRVPRERRIHSAGPQGSRLCLRRHGPRHLPERATRHHPLEEAERRWVAEAYVTGPKLGLRIEPHRRAALRDDEPGLADPLRVHVDARVAVTRTVHDRLNLFSGHDDVLEVQRDGPTLEPRLPEGLEQRWDETVQVDHPGNGRPPEAEAKCGLGIVNARVALVQGNPRRPHDDLGHRSPPLVGAPHKRQNPAPFRHDPTEPDTSCARLNHVAQMRRSLPQRLLRD